jgi:serine/threonine-protein kinase
VVVSRLHDQIGRVLGGRYRLIAPVGTGASALVFLADDTRLRRRVAVKLLHQALSDDEAFLRRFRAEAQAAASLNHPHILSVYDWGEDEHEPYLVTEYLGGGSLRAMLDKGNRLTVSQALLIGLETSRALDYAHKRGFVHRDIKPANLLFGEEGRLRVADFGLARALAEAAWTEPAGAMVGTARYASPEQARGEKVDGRGDVYSLGLVLIEAVSGEVPFASDTTIATLMARIDKPVEVPESLGSLRKVLTRVGNPDPDQRPDAGELAVGLLAAAEELARPEALPLAGATAATIELSEADQDRTQLPTGPPTVGVDATAAATVAVPPIEGAGPPAPPIVLAPPKRRRRWPKVALLILVLAALITGGLLTYRAVHVVSHPVPKLVGMTKDEAVAAATAKHWKVETRDGRADESVPGSVIEQTPAEGTKLAEDKLVILTISLGNTLTPVPVEAVANVPLDTATKILQDAGLVVGTSTPANSETVAKGSVISADPATPPQLPKGNPVNLIVSEGPAPRKVPVAAVGMTYDQAVAALAAVQLKANKVDVFDDKVAAGQVVAFDPVAGTDVPRDSTVNVQVSKGPHTIPDVSRLSVLDAADVLQKAGYAVVGVDGDVRRTVSSTNPKAGTPAPAGTGVTIITR